MRAEIVSVGTELLLGFIVDTNAAYLAQQLQPLGIDLYWISQVGDNLGRLTEVLRRAWERSDLTIVTGGLGPTEDDLTREAIAAVLGEEMRVVPELEQALRAYFAQRGRPMPERNLKQATLIPSAQVLPNPIGTAPGWWVERDGRLIVAMPGVPTEMVRMWTHEVVPRLLTRLGGGTIQTRLLKVWGIGESAVEEIIAPLIRSTNPTLATYAKSDGIHVRITAKAPDPATARAMLAPAEQEVRRLLGEAVYGADDETMAGVVGQLLRAREWSLATGETTTGGALASLITDEIDHPQWYRGGIVAPTGADLARLGVDPDLVAAHGLLSRPVTEALAGAVRRATGADLALALGAVLGPEPVDGQRPGTLHLALATPWGTVGQSEIGFGNTRVQIKGRAAVAALDFLRRWLLRADRSSAAGAD